MNISDEAGDSLARGLARSGLTIEELWWRYIGVGGTADINEFGAYVTGLRTPTPADRTVIAQALDDQFIESARQVLRGDLGMREPSTADDANLTS